MTRETSRARPPASSPAVARFMARLPRSGTAPELAIRRELHRRGLRFRVNVGGLPGRPDVAFTRARLAVFVDGCFWHGCPTHAVTPKANRDWWVDKIGRNQARDERNEADLVAAGWAVVRAWEHDDPGPVVDRVEALWRERTDRTVPS